MLLFAHAGLALASARIFGKADFAFLALGSMLPDILDKPLGLIVFGTPNMGRTFGHTLFFLLLLAALAYYYRDIRMSSLAWGVLIHSGLDFMWNSPDILLWPLLGDFPAAAYLDTLSYLEMLISGLGNPIILVPEILGFCYLIFFVYERRMKIQGQIKLSQGIVKG